MFASADERVIQRLRDFMKRFLKLSSVCGGSRCLPALLTGRWQAGLRSFGDTARKQTSKRQRQLSGIKNIVRIVFGL